MRGNSRHWKPPKNRHGISSKYNRFMVGVGTRRSTGTFILEYSFPRLTGNINEFSIDNKRVNATRSHYRPASSCNT